ncbi:RIP metalloprotease [Corynebacterium sp. TAE3-ERU12]|uniref:M50 family metallopeptidase n=1 Tax=Corynebacterium sp. TAE3-ERU12 TaxID=2849491 RepID=UPI001C46863D|nr:RIP metalloprotease [Corynebacterium sp. TAE3-ERU12]
MSFILGVVLFAVGIALTIALHEWGHLTAARIFGMRVRRYFIGFGPTIWSTKRRHSGGGGHITEYGVKAIPLGGFCDIAGMTAQDPISPEEEPYAMWRSPWWQRIIVLCGGIMMNVIIGIILIYIVAVAWGLPDRDIDLRPIVDDTPCVPATQNPDGTFPECTGTSPAAAAGLRSGDIITEVNGAEVETFADATDAIRAAEANVIDLTVLRGQDTLEVTVVPEKAQRYTSAGALVTVPAVGVQWDVPDQAIEQFGPVSAIPGAILFTGDMFDAVFKGLISIPEKVPGVVASIFGGERDPESPMSVVGASRAGGDLVERSMWSVFVMLLANLNFFLAFFNLIPLPPLDGGHIAVVIYERIRDLLRRARGLAPAGPADYRKLMPLTMAVTAVLLVFGVLVITADVVNPIRLFG